MHVVRPRSANRGALTSVLAAEQRRALRLFEVLDDVAVYSAGHLGMSALQQAWASIAELLLRMADEMEYQYLPALPDSNWYMTDVVHQRAVLTALRQAVDQVGAHRTGTEGWWLAVRDAAAASAAADRFLSSTPEGR